MAKKRERWQLEFKGPLESFDPLSSLDFWQNKSTLEKFKEVSNLVKQAQEIGGGVKRNVSRLLRTTAVIKRE